MRPISVFVIIFTVVLSAGWFIAHPAHADADNGKLTVPWDEFKRLINLDADEIVIPMATFQKPRPDGDRDAAPYREERKRGAHAQRVCQSRRRDEAPHRPGGDTTLSPSPHQSGLLG